MARNKDTGREMVQCQRCNGNGFVNVSRAKTDGSGNVTTVQNDEPCPACNGSGRVQA